MSEGQRQDAEEQLGFLKDLIATTLTLVEQKHASYQ
jgi:hypothetical protein